MVKLPLHQMSRVKKLQAMKALWADLSRDEEGVESPDWHAEALKETEAEVALGRAVDWDAAKQRLRRHE